MTGAANVSRQRGVPGIPLGALNAIEDYNTRVVLQAIADGWHVRNGSAGNGDGAFVTKAELGDLRTAGWFSSIAGQRGRGEDEFLRPGDVSRIVGDVQAAVFESALWKRLGERVKLIDLSLVAEQQARVAAVQKVADDLAAEAASRLGFDTVTGSKIGTLEEVTDDHAIKIGGLLTRTAASESQIINLQSTTAAQASSLTQLTTRTTEAESKITTLQTTTASQALTLSSLITRTTAAESSISTLQTTTQNQANSLSVLSVTVGQKARTFYQSSTPTASGVGDLWFKTGENNRCYRWDGAQWAPADDARIATNMAAITAEATARANADNAITTSVNTQVSAINSNVSALQTAQTTTANSVAALSSSVTTLQATVAGNTSAIQAEAEVRANADGVINSRYSVKIDTNGYVTGFGLMSEANNSTPLSSFIVRADRFAIGSPSGPDIAPAIPFVVLTTPQVINGATRQPGVYMQDAMIANAAIDTARIADAAITFAKIKDAEVGTLKIAGNAVTVPAAASGDAQVNVARHADNVALSTWQEVLSIATDFGPIAPSAALVCGIANLITQSGAAFSAHYMRVRNKTTGSASIPVGIASGQSIVLTNFALLQAAAGVNSFCVEITQLDRGGSYWLASTRSISVVAAKR